MDAIDLNALSTQLLGRLISDTDLADAVGEKFLPALKSAFDLAGQFTQQSGWADSIFGLSGATDAAAAFRLADALSAAFPAELTEMLTHALADDPLPDHPTSRTVPDLRPPRDVIKELLDSLKKISSVEAQNAADSVNALTSVYSGMWSLGAGSLPPTSGRSGNLPSGNLPSGKWSPENVARAVRDLIRAWIKTLTDASLPGPNTKRIAAEIEAEMTGPLEERLVLGMTFTGLGLVLYGIEDLKDLLRPASSAPIGLEVHEMLQRQYREAPWREESVIVQESNVYFSGTARSIAQVASTDRNVFALYTARDSYLLKLREFLKKNPSKLAKEVESSLRDDNLNLSSGTTWEIKPIRGAALGVVQEFTYRTFYNFYSALLLDLPGLAPVPISNLPRFWVTRYHLTSGTAADWPEIHAAPARAIGGGTTGRPVQAIAVVIVDTLPGLVLYFTYDLPAVVVAAFADELSSLLNRIAKRLRRGIRIAAVALVCALVVVLAIILLVALVLAAIEIGPLLLEAAAALATTLGPVLLAIGTRFDEVLNVLRRIVDAIGPLRQQFGLTVRGAPSAGDGRVVLRFTVSSDASTDAVPRATASVGPFRLENAPIQVLTALPGLWLISMNIAAGLVYKQFPGGEGVA